MALALEDNHAMTLGHRPGRRCSRDPRADHRDVETLHVQASQPRIHERRMLRRPVPPGNP
jgi:hypothetical protein